MSQGKLEEKIREKILELASREREEKTVYDLSLERTQKFKTTRQFLNVLRPIIKKSKTFTHYAGNGKEILFDTLYYKHNFIGWVEGMDYLIDSHFIYKEIIKLSRTHTAIPNELVYYWKLFRIGVIKPYKFHISPLYVKCIDKKPRCFFTISAVLVNIDAVTLDMV